MHSLNRWGLLMLATALGIGALWLAWPLDGMPPSSGGSPTAPASLLNPGRSSTQANLLAADAQWQPKSVSPSASASAVDIGPLYGRNGRELDFGGLTAAQYIDKHATAARRGDALAAYEVYKAESVCAVGNEAAPPFKLPEQRAQFLQERQTLATLCAKVSPAQLQERLGFLSQAARSGLREAQVDFYIEGPYGRPLDNISGDDPILKAWQEEAVAYLKGAVAQCDPYAMGLLVNAWDTGEFGKRDPGLAATYAVAEAQARRVPLSAAQLTRRFEGELNPEQIESSLITGQDLAHVACKNQ